MVFSEPLHGGSPKEWVTELVELREHLQGVLFLQLDRERCRHGVSPKAAPTRPPTILIPLNGYSTNVFPQERQDYFPIRVYNRTSTKLHVLMIATIKQVSLRPRIGRKRIPAKSPPKKPPKRSAP